jgi:hypothetical protein
MEAKERVVAWGRESLANIQTGKWWLVFLPIALWVVGGLAEDRFFHSINAYLDAQAPAFFAQLRAILTFKGPFALAGIGFVSVLLVLIVRAYLETQPGIVGTADLMLQELDIADLEITPDGSSYKIDLATFARIEVASLDKPRTVTRFEIEMIAPDKTVYRANSEYELGKYDHKFDVSQRNEWGGSSVRSERKPMEDLAAKVRTPIQPYTHVPRAWARFQFKGVKQGHEPKNCKITIWAVDPSGKRHEITTDAMQVKDIGDKEYAVAKGG